LRWPHLSGLGMVEVNRRNTITNEIENSTRFFLTSLDEGYELYLMSDLPQGTLPEKGKMYLEKKGEELRYLVQGPNGNTVDSLLSLKIADLNPVTLRKNRLRILAETGKRGHTLREQDIDRFMQAVRKHWNVEINLHWSLDV